MNLTTAAIVLLLCICHPIDGFSNGKCSRIRYQVGSTNLKSPIVKSTSTALSVGSILPTVYSAVAVASVIAFHEAGQLKDRTLSI